MMGEMMTSPCADCHDPLVVFLVSSGSRGDRLLFRYPYETDQDHETTLMGEEWGGLTLSYVGLYQVRDK